MSRPGREISDVERPFLEQLVSMGWRHVTGADAHPSATGRSSYREVLLLDDLRTALRQINPGPDGRPWLDDARISTAVSALQRIDAVKLMEANQKATDLLLDGVVVPGLPGWDGGRDRTVHFVDWDNPLHNTFLVVDQFRVDLPGGPATGHVVPDLVLFVNGIPLVVVECKSPDVETPVADAIDQLQRYSNQRHWVDAPEGHERLFHTNQLLVATCYEIARVGTVGAPAHHFREWKDTSPVPPAEVAQALGRDRLSSQETLVAGMLRPEHLLDLVRHFVLFKESSGRQVKIVARYQQFRAVQKAWRRLRTGPTRLEEGEEDRRGGVIWHTQGSGKSLTMVFLLRKMRSDPELRRFKVVVVTDRKDLQRQLSETAALAGDPVNVAQDLEDLKELVSRPGSGLVFAMIQKWGDRSEVGEEDGGEGGEGGEEGQEGAGLEGSGAEGAGAGGQPTPIGPLPVLNEDDSILVMVDEAHRSHTRTLHANLLRALPNAARIGFTGTPILAADKKTTRRIFGDFLDNYTLQQSERDGATVPILYEGRTAEASIVEGEGLDHLFEDLFADRTAEELERIKARYATRGRVLEAQALIAAKARDMLRHYVDHALPNGLKAQVVAVSRRATIQYREELRAARDELVAAVETLDREDPERAGPDALATSELPEERDFLRRARKHLDVLREMEFVPVISGGHGDAVDSEGLWTGEARQKVHVDRFKKPLFADRPEDRDPLAFLIVCTMLLTGFDAPVEGVMYLDRPLREHDLLQAIARVNRPYDGKEAGIVVDYYGVTRHLEEALAAYSRDDVAGVLRSLEDEIPKLRDRHRRVLDLFREHGVDDVADTEACVQLLEDPRLRADFEVKLKQFLATLDLVLPRPEALEFVADARELGHVHHRARLRYRTDQRELGGDVGGKVRRLIDEHVRTEGVDPRVPPVSILDADFADHVDRQVSDRAKASEMEHALRHHIRKHLDEDPEHYQRLSERLENILRELEGRWEQLALELESLRQDVQAGRSEDESGLDPRTQVPFLDLLRRAVATGGGGAGEWGAGPPELDPATEQRLRELTVDLVEHVRREIAIVDFWSRATAQQRLRAWIFRRLDREEPPLVPYEKLSPLADRLVALAKAKRHELTRPEGE